MEDKQLEARYDVVVQWEASTRSLEYLQEFYRDTKKAYYRAFPDSFKQFEDLYLKEQELTQQILTFGAEEPMTYNGFDNITWTLNEVV